ncbi:MAG: hydroxymethylglutaryl-CoA lyase [Planctomycetota bacterium]
MPGRVMITDVSPRDGLQNEPLIDGRPIATERKADLVRAAAAAGVDEVEVTSFVSPKWVPQLGDADELCRQLQGAKPDGVSFSALVPNSRGMESLLAVNRAAGTTLIDKVSVFTAASETFSQKNTNASIDETLERFAPVLAAAREHGLSTRGYISCAYECPFEGRIDPAAVAGVCERLTELGVDEVDLGDTIGKATPESTAELLQRVSAAVPIGRVVLHLHDTFGTAAACVAPALDAGVRSFDGSVGGLGGCPYASVEGQRAPGNIALRSLVSAVVDAGGSTKVDLDNLAAAEMVASGLVGASR